MAVKNGDLLFDVERNYNGKENEKVEYVNVCGYCSDYSNTLYSHKEFDAVCGKCLVELRQ